MDVTRLQDQLSQRAFLHDDPDAYLAGVRDALDVIAEDTHPDADDNRELRGA